jgi:hypothetical protein
LKLRILLYQITKHLFYVNLENVFLDIVILSMVYKVASFNLETNIIGIKIRNSSRNLTTYSFTL